MAINRRQFIKRSASAVTVSLMMPKLWLGQAHGQGISAAGRKIFVVIQLSGGNDGLNTVVPYTDSRLSQPAARSRIQRHGTQGREGQFDYSGQRAFRIASGAQRNERALRRGQSCRRVGRGLSGLEPLALPFDGHMETADIVGGKGSGWLGKYADQKLLGQSSLSAVNIGGSLPKAFFADDVVVPSISSFAKYTYQTDTRFAGDRNNQINTFHATNQRDFADGSFEKAIAEASVGAVDGAAQLKAAVDTYTSPVVYPSGADFSNKAVQFAGAMKMAAQIITTVPEANLVYVQMGGFDNHSQEIGTAADNFTDKTKGEHADLLKALSLGVKAFYDDMTAHNLADNVVMMTFSEFGRRPNENASHGSDHGTASSLFVIGNPVQGGRLYGEQPSLTDLDAARNLKFKVDFRSVYATILDKWLGADSQSILGAQFGNIGFLG